MMYIIRDIIFILLAIVGITEVARIIVFALLKSKNDDIVVLIVPVKNHMEDIEHVLRSTAAKVSFMGKGNFQKVICLDCNADKETKEICKKICSEFSFMEFEDKKEFVANI